MLPAPDPCHALPVFLSQLLKQFLLFIGVHVCNCLQTGQFFRILFYYLSLPSLLVPKLRFSKYFVGGLEDLKSCISVLM